MSENNIDLVQHQQQQPTLEQQQKKQKKPKEQSSIKPQHFQKDNGIKRLYQMTRDIDLDNAELKVSTTMKKIVCTLKTWQYNMAPKFNYYYFLQRCQTLGSHKQMQAYMQKVRRIHKGTDTWEQNIQQVNKNPDVHNKFASSMRQVHQMEENENILVDQAPKNIDKNKHSELQQQMKEIQQLINNSNHKAQQQEDSGVEIEDMYGVEIDDDYD